MFREGLCKILLDTDRDRPPKLHKRTPLTGVTWNGQSGTLEITIDKITGWIDQQMLLSYILLPDFYNFWLLSGDFEETLDYAYHENIHYIISFIKPIQFNADLEYLYGLLKTVFSHKGSEIIHQNEYTKDGITVWHSILQKYRFNGSVDVYLKKRLFSIYKCGMGSYYRMISWPSTMASVLMMVLVGVQGTRFDSRAQ